MEAIHVTPRHSWYFPVKRIFDFFLAVLLLVLFTPMILLGVLLVKLTSRGPALYRQVRLGKNGRPFTLLKLRTMRHNAEAETGPVWSTGNDSRITAVGRLLRQTHIDEFPQLWNVIRGEMSLVGPRPERPEFVSRLEWEIPFYRERLKVRPGITGLAQLRLPADTDLDSVRRKVVHDVYYVRHANPAVDAKLLVLTAWLLITEIYDYCWKAATVPATDEVERDFRRTLGIRHEESQITLTSIQANKETKPEISELGTIDG
jgi:lipopolysaccharide/colanic/teichoic acid biosynthesis glycosyltransferase